ncbi:hypothetical protein SAMN05421846_110127 [Chryseobacterium taeanense]|uniref:Uncharacterized protein n=1 Tax=Chryseobacterium taeanense TaxID=311334 RepID=A0A1G8LZZ3_9FLAO|nr:hypothetical protein SAMN05421846_110127 [Chryseobacterium taeanense]
MNYFNNGSSVEVLEENNYYPFGLKHEGYNALAGNSACQYKYSGKELQTETGMYDLIMGQGFICRILDGGVSWIRWRRR